MRFAKPFFGGFVIAMLRRIPTSGNHFNAVSFRFEVVDRDGTRVDKVLVTPIASEAAALNQLDSDTGSRSRLLMIGLVFCF
jgi:Mg2+/Co2+ transporter CorC